ncbi:hypothetical protein J7E63_14945 [Bacillus sp. ISL-75]|uniref:hypothetical protein n=1 Tax=Bacillus sp. ISL-75 TaxID=2819137 RepID=UPI001BE9B767|nr:hypothetical protein [Bacillus sp. ISL-75]MBT2728235.1 hypothetical protein [Bacillus sp. ISL-75]
MNMFGLRLLLTVFLLILLELIVINIAGILPFIAAHRDNLSDAPYFEFITDNLLHPIENSTLMIEEKNPLFFLGSGAVILLSFYATFFMKGAKGKYQLADKYGVHGSSRFAHKHEIFKQGEIVGVPVNQLMKDLEASLLVSKEEK